MDIIPNLRHCFKKTYVGDDTATQHFKDWSKSSVGSFQKSRESVYGHCKTTHFTAPTVCGVCGNKTCHYLYLFYMTTRLKTVNNFIAWWICTKILYFIHCMNLGTNKHTVCNSPSFSSTCPGCKIFDVEWMYSMYHDCGHWPCYPMFPCSGWAGGPPQLPECPDRETEGWMSQSGDQAGDADRD